MSVEGRCRQELAAKRQEINSESRKLRRVRIGNNRKSIAERKPVVGSFKMKLRVIRNGENDEIREVLTLEQNDEFHQELEQRRTIPGCWNADDRAIRRGPHGPRRLAVERCARLEEVCRIIDADVEKSPDGAHREESLANVRLVVLHVVDTAVERPDVVRRIT